MRSNMAKQCWRKNVFDYLANLIYDDQLDLYDYCASESCFSYALT